MMTPTTAPYIPGSDTSKASALLLAKRLGKLEKEVYHFLLSQGDRGAANWEIEEALGKPDNCISPRMAPLRRAGYVVDSGRRITNPKTKRKTAVWTALAEPRQVDVREPSRVVSEKVYLRNRVTQLEYAISLFREEIKGLRKEVPPIIRCSMESEGEEYCDANGI